MRIRDRARAWLGTEDLVPFDQFRVVANSQTAILNEIRGGIASIMKRMDDSVPNTASRLAAIESTLANLSIATEASAKAPVRPIYAPVMSADWEALQAAGMKEFEEK